MEFEHCELTSHSGESFMVVPALDVLRGRCVSLAQGDVRRIVWRGGRPADELQRLVSLGNRLVHVVDLDGAFRGSPTPGLVEELVAVAGDAEIQIGGGLRTVDAVAAALDAGASRAVIGTSALSQGFLRRAVARVDGQLIVSIDWDRRGVARDGWRSRVKTSPREVAERCAASRVPRLIVTGVSRDGTRGGPDLRLLESILSVVSMPVLAAGGIRDTTDLARLRDLGCEGAIVGLALWTGRFG